MSAAAVVQTVKLSADQQEALDAIEGWAVSRYGQVFSFGGLAGTGKTTTLGAFASRFRGLAAYVALTGRASAVLRSKLLQSAVETTNALRTRESAKGNTEDPGDAAFCGTLHRLMYKPVVDDETQEVRGYVKRATLDRSYDLIVVDEASMISDDLLAELRAYLTPILLVGDHGQLAPVKSSSNSVIAAPNVKLDRIHRQAAGNPIIVAAHGIREGKTLQRAFLDAGVPCDRLVLHRKDAFERRVRRPVQSNVVVCWTNKMRVRLNCLLRAKAGFSGPPRKGEIVIALRNEPPVYNGMRGVLTTGAVEGKQPWHLAVQIAFPEDDIAAKPYLLNAAQFNRAEEAFNSVEELRDRGIDVHSMKAAGAAYDFGYALSCHKAQGSTFRDVAVYLDRPERPYEEDWRRWMYTALTRAAETLTVFA